MEKKKKRFSLKLIGVLFSIVLLWFATSFVIGMVKENLIKKMTLTYGPVKNVISTTGYLLRQEEVVSSPYKGELKKTFAEGERVRINTVVAEVVTPSLETSTGQASNKIKAPRAGVVSYKLDGLENLFTLENWEKLKPQQILELEEKKQEEPEVSQGKPLLKIVDNLAPAYVYLQLKEKEVGAKLFTEGEYIGFKILNEDLADFQGDLTGQVAHVRKENGYIQVLLTNHRLRELALANRKLELEITKNKFEGYIIPKDSLITKDGKNGVYLIYKQVVRWAPVEIVGSVDDQVAVKNVEGSDWLNENMEIILNHELVEERQKLN